MNATSLTADASGYPPSLREGLGEGPAPVLAALGDLGLLRYPLLGLFCSVRCPGDVILRTYDLVRLIRKAGIAVIGGFHSPMEKECLALLLRGSQPLVVCPARCIEGMRLPLAWRGPLAEESKGGRVCFSKHMF